MAIIHKTISSTPKKTSSGIEFILSDATPDRYGDIILAEGWDLVNFNRNPIALFGHRSDFPIGRWDNLKVKDGALRGFLELAPKGTSERIDEIRALVEADILRAVSVGFRPLESKPISNDSFGEIYMKQELVETSVVSVPANPNALAVAKSLGISSETQNMIFAKCTDITITERDYTIREDGKTVHVRKPKSIIEPPLVHVTKWGDQEFVTPIQTTIWNGKRVPV